MNKLEKKIRIIVCQHGARHRYLVPRILDHEGMLAKFYTDSSNFSPLGKLAKLLGNRAPNAFKRLSNRIVKNVSQHKINSSDANTILELMQRLLNRNKSGIDLFVQRHQILSKRMISWGCENIDYVYSMYHENLDFLKYAKKLNTRCIIDVYISPITDEIMAKEYDLIPEWANVKSKTTLEKELALWKESVELSDMLICPSEWVAEGVLKLSPNSSEKIRVVPYGCSIDYKDEINIPIVGRVLFAGGDPLRKGLHYLAETTNELGKELEELDVRIAGDLPDSVTQHPLCTNMNFLGKLSSQELKKEFLSADVFVLPALSEGFAGVIAEAISAGCPVIITKESGAPIISGREGIVIPSRNSNELSKAIKRMVLDRKFRNECSKNCIKQRPFYSEEAWGERLIECIENFHQNKGISNES
ncbi:glycosyltransferase family 4 protein [Vibrio sp. 1978]|uniref:glycosyltransferase family 4 protein n=1 Tax=Vibrio sp. 1978 TaxID=3074585 RepID=UPI0029676483|nr:glycosyltransferase family 4 protein [Vibrio sp. 1978]MDW3056445.1 glycosyltransferase family 4 protein [Vibrio sp. 1978]